MARRLVTGHFLVSRCWISALAESISHPGAAAPSVGPRLAELEHRHERLLDELDGLNQRIEAALEGLGVENVG